MLDVTLVPCLTDNYAYVLRDPATGECAVVDPSEAEPVLAALASMGARPTMVLNTHHHYDHVGGNEALVAAFPGLRVVAHASDQGRVPGQTDAVSDGDRVALGGTSLRVLHVPGHTLGAVTYASDDAAFTGDTLFLGGCGRLFEGDPAMMYASLRRIAETLDPATRVFCGHEYTANNLRFVASLEPGNREVADALADAERLRASDRPTVPKALRDERRLNPFLRCDDPALAAAVGVTGDAVAVFAALRERRNIW
jgi:hydroxyacylglutathione hydrolase